MTGTQSDFETSIGTWVTSGNSSIVRTTAQAYNGVASLQITATALGDASAQHISSGGVPGQGFLVQPGDSCHAYARFRAATTPRNCEIGINWINAAGTFLSTSASSFDPPDTTTGWVTAAVGATAPANAARAIVFAKIQGAAASEVHYVDDVHFGIGAFGTPQYWGPGSIEGVARYEMQIADMPSKGNLFHPNISGGGEYLNDTLGWYARGLSDQLLVSQQVPAKIGTKQIKWVPAITDSELHLGTPPLGNLLTPDDSGFEGGVGAWSSAVNCSVAQSAAQALEGTKSLAITATAAADMTARTPITPNSAYSAKAGKTYSVRIPFRANTTGRNVQALISWFDHNAVQIGANVAGTQVADVTTGWTEALVSGVAPDGTEMMSIRAQVLAPGAGEVHYIDRVLITVNDSSVQGFPIAVVPGRTYQARVWARTYSGSYQLRAKMVFLQQDGTHQSTIGDSGVVTISGTYTELVTPAVVAPLAPTTTGAKKTIYAKLLIENTGGVTGFPIFFDAPELYEVTLDYLTGEFTPGIGVELVWSPWRGSVDPETGNVDAIRHTNDIVSQQEAFLLDYEVPVDHIRVFRIREIAAQSGTDTASDWHYAVAETPAHTGWWIKDVFDPSLNFQVYVNVRPQKIIRPVKRGVFSPVSGGSSIVVKAPRGGVLFGAEFVITGDNDWFKFLRMLDQNHVLLIQSPSNDQWYVDITNDPETTHYARGSAEMAHRVTPLEFVEVNAP
jgi:hypothetical protein